MIVYTFTGFILPERATFHLPNKIPGRFKFSPDQQNCDATIHILANQVVCECSLKKHVEDLWTLKNIVTNLVQGLVDNAGLILVVGYTVDIRTVSFDGKAMVFPANFPGIGPDLDDPVPVSIPIKPGISSRPLLQRAAADIRSAILIPHDTGFYGYRSVESVIHQLKFDKIIKKKIEAFTFFDRNLGIPADHYDFLKKVGGPARHGEIVSISAEERKRTIQVARATILRIAEWYDGKTNNWDVNQLPN